MVVTLVIVAAVRLRLLNLPLERDEGEYAYAGQLMLQGIPPYQLAYNMKFPGTYAAYAVIMALFGQTPAGIHFGVLCLTTLTALMLFWLGKKMLDPTAGIVSASAYAVLAASPSMLGLAGHATHFCAFFAIAGLCAMWQARQHRNWLVILAAGLLFGTAVLMKQQAALIALWASLAWIVWLFRQTEIPPGKRLASLASFGVGIVVPFALCCLILWQAGVFRTFWFWTVDLCVAIRLSCAPKLRAPVVLERFSVGDGPGIFAVADGRRGTGPDLARRTAETVARVAFGILLRVRTGGLSRFLFSETLFFDRAACGGVAGRRRRECGETPVGATKRDGPVKRLAGLDLRCRDRGHDCGQPRNLVPADGGAGHPRDLWSRPVSRSGSRRGLHSGKFAAGRAAGRAGFGAGNLFSRPPPLGHRLHLHLRADGIRSRSHRKCRTK